MRFLALAHQVLRICCGGPAETFPARRILPLAAVDLACEAAHMINCSHSENLT